MDMDRISHCGGVILSVANAISLEVIANYKGDWNELSPMQQENLVLYVLAIKKANWHRLTIGSFTDEQQGHVADMLKRIEEAETD